MSFVSVRSNQSYNTVKKATEFLAVFVALLLISLPLFSQGSQGTIQGTVFDQSGGVIAGATVAVIDVARGVTRNLVADDAGQYVASNLNPGTYTVRAEFKGFSAEERGGVMVEVGQNIRVDLKLQAGEQTQTITVTGEIPSIDTTDATLGGTVSNSAILSLPLNGRNFFRLLELRPGVITDPGATSGASSTNGRRLGADLLLVEGIPQIELTTANTTINGNYKGGGDSSNLLPIDAVHHENHLPRGLLHRRVGGIGRQIVGAFRGMAIDAIQTGGGGKETHRVHELFYGDSLEQLDVLENVLGHQWLLLRAGTGRLSVCPRNPHKARNYRPQDALNHSLRSYLHVGYSPWPARGI